MKNKLEKLRIGYCEVSIPWDAREQYPNVYVAFRRNADRYSETIMGITFMRTRLSFVNHDAFDQVWEAHRMATDAEKIGGTMWDVGAIPYGTPFYPELNTNRIEEVASAAKILAALDWADGEIDTLLERVKKAGCPLEVKYHGRNDTHYSDTWDVPREFRGKTLELARSPEAAEAKANYLLREAERQRQYRAERAERERAATAEVA